MMLGAYSIVRFSNYLNDQRVNLGVMVWHPLDGFAQRFSPYLDRAKAVDPQVRVKPLKKQLDLIRDTVSRSVLDEGKGALQCLSEQFREGLEVTAPYPAKIFSLAETLEKLYERLVSPVPEIIGVSNQRQFEKSLKTALASAVAKVTSKGRCEAMGSRQINGVSVDVGIRTTFGRKTALWRGLSLQSKDRTAEQVMAAKATAMEILTIQEHVRELKKARQMVVLQPPKPKAADHLSESIAWLRHKADDVIPVAQIESLPTILEAKLAEMV